MSDRVCLFLPVSVLILSEIKEGNNLHFNRVNVNVTVCRNSPAAVYK